MLRQWFDTKEIALGMRSPAFLMISFIALALGYWFALNQIDAVVPGGLASYPKEFFIITIFKCYLTIIAFYGVTRVVLLELSDHKLTPLAVAFSFTPLLLVLSKCQLYWIALIVILFQCILLLSVLNKADYQRLVKSYLTDSFVFILFFMLHLFLTTRYSPLHWNMSILTADGYYTDEGLVLSPMFRGFVLAKQFSFSFIDHAQWAGIMHTPFLLNSPLMQLLTFVFDLPSASFESFHQVLMTLYFILIILGSFGFYLFLKYAAKVHVMFAIWGGVLFAFSGDPVMDKIMGYDSGVFYSSYAVFPYALLLISLAFEKNSRIYAMWAAIALATQLFIFAPHPEGLLYSSLFYFLYTIGLVIFSRNLTFKKRINLLILSETVFILLTIFDVMPIFFDRFTGNMYVIGHIGDIKTVSIKLIRPYINIVLWALPVSLLLRKLQNQLSAVYLSTIFLTCCMLLLLLMGRHASFMTIMSNVLHFGIHFTYYWRFAIYFCLLAFTIMTFVLDDLTSLSYKWISNRFPTLIENIS